LVKVSFVALKRLTPTTKDLGYLQLWQDDLEEMVLLVRQQLSSETIVLESDGRELEDVAADLPNVGRRVQYFTIKVTGKPEEGDEGSREILTVSLTRDRCKVEAMNPDAATRGVIGDIQDIAQRCRRVPLWYPHAGFFSLRSTPGEQASAYTQQMSAVALGCVLLFAASCVGSIIGALAVSGELTFGSSKSRMPLGGSLGILVPSAIILIILIIGEIFSRTTLFTGTRQNAPTFWQRNGASIIISVVVAAVFYLLGLWTASS
jgi:hypothetical protein